MITHQAFLILMLTSFLGTVGLAEPDRHMGITLPLGTKQIAANRFQSPRPYVDTVREMRQRFSASRNISQIGDEINLPHVRATSFVNSDKTSPFMAINIYTTLQTGLTEIFFVSRK